VIGSVSREYRLNKSDTMTAEKARRGPDPVWRPDFNEIIRRMHKEEMRSWLQPKSGDLLRDVIYLQASISGEKNSKIRGIYARATIVMGVATIEAVTNDALATIYELLTDSIPSECAAEPPWCYFIGKSTRRILSLLRRGSFVKKRDYILRQIERNTGDVIEETLLKNMDQLRLFRNRIVHMSYQYQPGRYGPMLNSGQAAHVAALASDCAHDYLDFLSYEFSELKLPIRSIRPHWHFDDDLRSTPRSPSYGMAGLT